jgi:hypothetical protein
MQIVFNPMALIIFFIKILVFKEIYLTKVIEIF